MNFLMHPVLGTYVMHITAFKSQEIVFSTDDKIYVRKGAQSLPVDNDEKISSIHEYNIFTIIVSKPYSFAFFNLIDQKWSNKKNFSDYGRFDFFNISNKLLGIVRNTNIYILNMETQIFVKKCNFEQKILAITVFNNNQLLLSVLNSFNSSSNLIQYKFDEHSFIEISKKKFAHHDYIKQIIQYNYNYIITVGDIIKFWK